MKRWSAVSAARAPRLGALKIGTLGAGALLAGALLAGALLAGALLVGSVALAQDEAGYRGLFLTTSYPAQTISRGEASTIDLKLYNFGLPPQRVALAVRETPADWQVSILGGGKPVEMADVLPDDDVNLRLRLEPPAEVPAGSYDVVIAATGPDGRSELPLRVEIGEVLPPRLTLETNLPALRGTASSSFSYNVTLKNESDVDLQVNLQAEAPPGVRVTFNSSGQDVTSIPVNAGATQRITVRVNLPRDTPAGQYGVLVRAISEEAQAELPLAMEVTGQPELDLAGPGGRVSARAQIGRETPLELVLANRGSAPAEEVVLSATAPQGWKVEFDPEEIAALPAGQQQQVKVLLTPSQQAVAGDYLITMRARAQGVSDSAEFRITAVTSTLWGIVGVVVIAVALLVVALAVARYGRR